MPDRRAVALLALAVLLVVAPAGAATTAEERAESGSEGRAETSAGTTAGARPAATELSGCTTITESGEYVLSDDVESADAETCIAIRADDVTLEGAGHAIDGGSLRQSSAGVSVASGSANVAVRNLTVSRWGFGVRYEGVTEGEIADVTARFAGDGIRVENSRGVVVRSATADNNFVGVAVSRSERVVIEDVSARWNAIYGVSLAESESVAVSNLAVRGNADRSSVPSSSGFDAVRPTDVALTATRDSRVENLTTGANWSVTLGSRSVNASVSVRAEGAETLSMSGSGVVVSSVTSPPTPAAYSALGEAFRAEATAPNATLSLELHYADADLATAGVDETTLGLWRYDESVWAPVGDRRSDPNRNLVRATVTDFSTFAVLGGRVAEAADTAADPGPIGLTRQGGVEIDFACDGVRVSVPPRTDYSLVVRYFVPESGVYEEGLLGPLNGTVVEPFDDEIVFFEVNVLVGGATVASGYIPESCPNAPRLALVGPDSTRSDGDKP